MKNKLGKVSGLMRLLEEEDVEKKINETEEDKVEESDDEEKKDESEDEDGDKVEESEDEDGDKKDESDDEEKKDESDEEEKKDEVDPQTVDDDQVFVGESADDDDDLVLLTAGLDDDDDVSESEDEEKKDESDDEEKKDESEDEDGDKKDESDDEEKIEEEEEEKLEGALKSLGIDAAQFVECKAILRELVSTKAERLARKAESKIRKRYSESFKKRLKKMQENVNVYAKRAAQRYIEQNKAKFVESAQYRVQAQFVDKLATVFSEYGIEVSPKMKKIVSGLKSQVNERNLEIDRLHSENETLVRKVEAHKIAGAIKSLTEGMVKTDSERFVRIVEGLEIKNYEDFMKKATSVKERVFSEKSEERVEYTSFVERHKVDDRDMKIEGVRKSKQMSGSLVEAAASIISENG